MSIYLRKYFFGRKTKISFFLFLTPQNLYFFEYQRNTTHFLIEWKRVGCVDVILITTNLEISFKDTHRVANWIRGPGMQAMTTNQLTRETRNVYKYTIQCKHNIKLWSKCYTKSSKIRWRKKCVLAILISDQTRSFTPSRSFFIPGGVYE